MNAAQLKKALALISANTKRLARVSFTTPQPRKPATRKPKRAKTGKRQPKNSEFYSPPRAPEVTVEPVFKPTPPRPIRAVAAKAPVPTPVLTPKRTTGLPEAFDTGIPPPRILPVWLRESVAEGLVTEAEAFDVAGGAHDWRIHAA